MQGCCGQFSKCVIKDPIDQTVDNFNIKVINLAGMYHGFCDVSLVSNFSDYLLEHTSTNLVLLYRIDETTGKYLYSVRSSGKVGSVPARIIAEYYGGGGHDNAAGFSSDTILV
jgi:oligoribonuclease NrnB/cAMP/cGMP phosphodiesterase (DHH superfamily)